MTSKVPQFLKGKTVSLFGFSSLDEKHAVNEINSTKAIIVAGAYEEEVDYTITPASVLHTAPTRHTKNLVTMIWFDESVAAMAALPVAFHHKPVVHLSECYQSLRGENVVTSGYSKVERKFIKNLVTSLGGIFKEALNSAEKPILICQKPEGLKYNKCIEKSFAAVKIDWLLGCYKFLYRIKEDPYLVGKSVTSRRNGSLSDETSVPSSQPPNTMFLRPLVDPLRRDIVDASIVSVECPLTPTSANVRDLKEEGDQGEISKELSCLRGIDTTLSNLDGKSSKTLETSDSPMPKLPACMFFPDKNYALFPNSSPGCHWFYKRKLEALDENYIERGPRKPYKPPTPEIPYAVRRYLFYKKRIPDYDSPDPRVPKSAQYIVPVHYQEELYDEAVGVESVKLLLEQNKLNDQNTQTHDGKVISITTQLEYVQFQEDKTVEAHQQIEREVPNDVEGCENSKVETQQAAVSSSTHDGTVQGNLSWIQKVSPECENNEALNFGPSTNKTKGEAEKSKFATDENASNIHSLSTAGRDDGQKNKLQFAEDNSIAQAALNFLPSQSIHEQSDEENLNQEATTHNGNHEKYSLAAEAGIEEVLNAVPLQSESFTGETNNAAGQNQNTAEDSDSSDSFSQDASELDVNDQSEDESSTDHEDQDNSMMVPDFGD